MKTFYKILFLIAVYVGLWLVIPVMFSAKSDLAVICAVLILASVPVLTWAYLRAVKIISN